MNSKKIILLSCVVPCVFAVSTATAQMRGHTASRPGMPMQRAPMAGPTARTPMQRTPMLNSTSRFNRFNDHDRDDRFRRFNRVIVFNDFGFGFPFFASFPFYYPYPYPYPYYGYGYGADGSYGYGGGYGGYGGSASVVVEVQRRLASAGFYSGAIDGIVGSGTRRAIRAFERSHGLPADGAINRRLLAAMGLA